MNKIILFLIAVSLLSGAASVTHLWSGADLTAVVTFGLAMILLLLSIANDSDKRPQ